MPDAVARQYDRAARAYDRRWAGYVRDTHALLDAVARVRPAERVLDVGCGTGMFAARLAARHPAQRVVGVDVSAGMLAEARRTTAAFPNVRFECAPATALPVADAAFDVVVTASALHYVRDPGAALAEARRVLRPGGRFVFVEHVAAEPGSVLRPVQRALRAPWGVVADGCRPDRDTEALIRAACFADVAVERFRLPLGLVAPHIAGVATKAV